MKILKYIITLKQPTVILKKRGKGNFYVASDIIPGSTISGAIAVEYLRQMINQENANCGKIFEPEEEFSCSNCPINNCKFRDIIYDKKIQFSSGIPIDKADEIYPVGHVSSIVRSATEPDKYYDILLQTAFMRYLVDENKFNFNLFKAHKKRLKKANILINSDLEIQDIHYESHDHVAIERVLKSSKSQLLYSNIALSPEQKFYGIGFDETDDFDITDKEIWIGGNRSRGYGRSKIHFEQVDYDEYLKQRIKSIKEGFEEIKKLSKKYGIEATIATITGISPLELKRIDKDKSKEGNEESIRESLSQSAKGDKNKSEWSIEHSIRARLSGIDFEILSYFAREDQLPRWNRKEDLPLEFTPVIQQGYSVAIKINSNDDLDSISEKLAKKELDSGLINNSLNWIYVNHPVHYKKSTLLR